MIIEKIKGNNVLSDLENVENEIFRLYEPLVFSGANGYEVNEIKSFERTCIMLQQQLNVDAKKMTVLEYFEALNLIKEQIKEQKKLRSKK